MESYPKESCGSEGCDYYNRIDINFSQYYFKSIVNRHADLFIILVLWMKLSQANLCLYKCFCPIYLFTKFDINFSEHYNLLVY